ncbi:hypothetical protein CJ030_MR1G029348 [Morella rubra]|uniref:DUF641 domain-containing protein n=1 Tax=Morella rubra TaxID=262757 RepID=A0A6A1WPT0_9ROSI|nr:hypothetical protein CJ030_MR1G029348 [Morella rubra]
MLAEIQEQQGLMKTYEIGIKKLEAEVELKDSDITLLKSQLEDSIAYNKSMENRLNSNGSLSMFNSLGLTKLNTPQPPLIRQVQEAHKCKCQKLSFPESKLVIAKFTRSKYLHLVHAKMECSLFGNLSQQKVNFGGVLGVLRLSLRWRSAFGCCIAWHSCLAKRYAFFR